MKKDNDGDLKKEEIYERKVEGGKIVEQNREMKRGYWWISLDLHRLFKNPYVGKVQKDNEGD